MRLPVPTCAYFSSARYLTAKSCYGCTSARNGLTLGLFSCPTLRHPLSSDSSTPPPIRVLLADDEPALRRAITVAMQLRGFQITPAADGNEARAVLGTDQPVPFDVLITDIDMPGCDGVELATQVRAKCAGIKVVYTSGQPQPKLVAKIKGDTGARFMGKPFTGTDLVKCVNELCGR